MSTLKVDNLLLLDNTKGTGRILEMVGGICDGQSITTLSGTYSLENVTSSQTLSTSYADQKGSSITYKPPEGTKQVIYKLSFMMTHVDTHGLSHHRFYIDDDEVTDARTTYGGQYQQLQASFEWIIPIGGVADIGTTGRLSSWTTLKTLKIQARDYSSSNDAILHSTQHWDGSGTDVFHRPKISVTAIG